MRSLPWLLGTLAVVLGGIWLTTRRGGAAYTAPVAVAPEVPAERPHGEEPPAPMPAAVVASEPALVDPFVALHRDLDAAFGTSEELGVLERIADLGRETRDERAYELILATLANPASKLSGSQSRRDALLGRAHGSRSVGGFAGETVESHVATGEGFERIQAQSFQVLLASNGLPTGLWTLVDQLSASDAELAKGAAEALRSARPVDAGLREELREALFGVVLAPRACAIRYELALALLALDRVDVEAGEPGVVPGEALSRPRLLDVVFEGAEVDLGPGRSDEGREALVLEIRGDALLALAEAFDADTLRRSIEFYENRPVGDDADAALRDRVPGMWSRLSAPPSDAKPEERAAHREPLAPLEQFLLHVLNGADSRSVAQVREALRGPAFQPLDPALAAALAAHERD